jgi:hypothetical protein
VKENISIKDAINKYPWWDYRGDEYESTAIIADDKDDLVLKKKKFNYTYNWVYLTYDEKAAVLDKVKLRNDNGDRYFHFRNWTQNESEEFLYALCGVNDKSDELKYCKEFRLLKINKDLNVVKDLTIKFDYPQDIVYPRFVDDKTESRRGKFDKEILLVFAPKYEGSKFSDPDKTNFTYVGVNENLEVTDRIPFKSESTGWSIEDKIIDDQHNEVYFFGASLKGKNKYFSELKDNKKFDGFQVMKISDHKLAYLKEYSLDELSAKMVKSPSQKEATPYQGKKFIISAYSITSEGSLIIVGQNWGYPSTTGLTGRREVQYFDCFGLGFDKSGDLIAQYLYDMKSIMGLGRENSKFQFLFTGKDPGNVYWLLIERNYWSWASYAGMDLYDERPSKPVSMSDLTIDAETDIPFVTFPVRFKCDLVSSDFGKIDLKNGTMTNFANYQTNKEKKAYYYLCPKMPFILTDDHKLVLFGSQSMKKGKTLWFGRINLE